jgi:hypothetical protein
MRWSYEKIGEAFEALADPMLDNYANGGSKEEWEESQAKINALFERAGWTHDQFDAEIDRRIRAKLS